MTSDNQTLLADDFRAKALGLKHLTKLQLQKKLSEVPLKLRAFTIENCVLTGGFFVSVYHNEKVNDYDLYLKDISKMEELRSLIQEYVGPDQPEEQPYSQLFVNGKVETTRAITLNNRLQYVIMYDFKTAKTQFDYVHCRVNYDLKDDVLWMSKEQLESIKSKKLMVYNANNVLKGREKKFLDRGWKL